MKTIGYLLVALLPLTANAVTYPVDVEQQLNGAEAPRTRRTALQPGERKALTSKFKRDVIRLRIKLTCQPE